MKKEDVVKKSLEIYKARKKRLAEIRIEVMELEIERKQIELLMIKGDES